MKTKSLYATSFVALLAFPPGGYAQQVARIPAGDRVLAGSPVIQYAIGAEDGEDWELLSRVSGVAFDASDNLFVLDAGNNRVLVFDARGKFVRKFGKKGGGPGELMSPVGLVLTRDGYVAVTDLGRPGVSLFKPDGSFVKNLMMGDSLGFPTPQNGTQAFPGGGVIVRSNPIRLAQPIRTNGRPNAAALGGPTGPRKSSFTLLATNGSVKKVFELILPSIDPKVTNSGGGGNRQVMVRVSQPGFSPPILWAVLPDGTVAIADEAAYKIKIARDGKVVRTIERNIPVRKVTDHDKNIARDLRRKQMKSGVGAMSVTTRVDGGRSSTNIGTGGGIPRISDADIQQAIDDMTFLDLVPNLQRMTVDSKGRFWIQRQGKEYGQDGPFDIIDATGRYIGTVNGKVPDAFSMSGRVAYITRDEMDVEKVEVKKLPNW